MQIHTHACCTHIPTVTDSLNISSLQVHWLDCDASHGWTMAVPQAPCPATDSDLESFQIQVSFYSLATLVWNLLANYTYTHTCSGLNSLGKHESPSCHFLDLQTLRPQHLLQLLALRPCSSITRRTKGKITKKK